MSGPDQGDERGPSFAAPADDTWTPSSYRGGSVGTPLSTPLTPRQSGDQGGPRHRPDLSPRRRWLPALLTAVAVLVVGGVATVASLRPDVEPTASRTPVVPVRLTAPRANASPAVNQVPFSTPSGEGVLTVVDHARSQAGRRLGVTVAVTALRGEIEVDPSLFSILDDAGGTHELIYSGAAGDELPASTLSAGQSITGQLAFEVPDGQLVLLMGDNAQGITAIKLPG